MSSKKPCLVAVIGISKAGGNNSKGGDRVDLPLTGKDLDLREWPVEILARREAQ